MPFDQHQEKDYPQPSAEVFQAAVKACAGLGGNMVTASAEKLLLAAKFPKVILGKTLGERTHLTCQVLPSEAGSRAVIDAYPLDAVERRLMFGARPGVTLTVVTLFVAQLEHNLGSALS